MSAIYFKMYQKNKMQKCDQINRIKWKLKNLIIRNFMSIHLVLFNFLYVW